MAEPADLIHRIGNRRATSALTPGKPIGDLGVSRLGRDAIKLNTKVGRERKAPLGGPYLKCPYGLFGDPTNLDQCHTAMVCKVMRRMQGAG